MKMLTSSRHQEDGIHFVLQREDSEFSRHLSARLCQSIGVHCAEINRTEVAFGGLIADIMRLGKTLTILVSILCSIEKSMEFGHFNNHMKSGGINTVPTKATLVVVPSARKYLRCRWIS